MKNQDADQELPVPEAPVADLKLGGWRIAGAGVLILLSLVSSVTLWDIELTGGATLAALAALVLLWPLIPQLLARGGNAEFLGLKIKLNALERRSEEEVGVRMEELSADLEALRLKVGSALSPGSDPTRSSALPAGPVDEERLAEAVRQYVSYPETKEWDSRVAVDKRLIAAGSFDVRVLTSALDGNEENRETAMAVAVALGTINPGEGEEQAVEALVRLLAHRSGRVRYRAARSIMRLLRRKDLLQDSRFSLVEASRARANVEKISGVCDELIRVVADFG